MANIPTFSQLANYRYNGFNNAITPRLIGYGAIAPEERTVPGSAPYIILLHESPQFNVPSTTRIWDDTDGVYLTEVSKTTTPANRQFRVNYDERGNGQVEFNGNQKNHALEISYYGEGSLAKIETLQSTQQAITSVQITDIDTDTILDDDQAGLGSLQLEFDCRTGNKIVTLPDAGLNEGLIIGWKILYWGGRAILRGKGGNTIDGYSEIYGDDKDNRGELYSNGVEWKIRYITHTIKFFDDWRPNSDWTTRNLGSLRVTVDNEDPGNPIEGEVFIESTTNLEFILQEYDAVNHYMYFKNAEGNCTNNETLTGQTSGWACDVNEATGSTKNIDSPVFPNVNKNINKIINKLYISTDGTSNNSFFSQSGFYAYSNSGLRWGTTDYQVDANSFIKQTAANGVMAVALGAGDNIIDIDDYDYLIETEIIY